jgi:hypothetical protein
MPHETEHQPGTPAPVTGHYRLVNVFGSAIAHSAHVRRGEKLPMAPRGGSWRLEQETDDDE